MNKLGTKSAMKYDSNGNATWIRQVGATGQQSACWGPSVDTTGNVFVAGYTQGGIDGNTLTGNQDMFVAKYNSLGTLQ